MILPAEVLAVVSHEMRTPLTAITGYATTLLRHASHLPLSEQQEFLHAILSAGKRLEYVINHLMELTRVETLSHLTGVVPVNLRSLVEETITALPLSVRTTSSGKERIVLRQSILKNDPGEEWYTVPGDRTLLRHLFDHLLDNALRFSTPDKTVELCVSRQPAQAVSQRLTMSQAYPDPLGGTGREGYLAVPPPQWPASAPLVEVQITDHGPGIAPDDLPGIFERFSQIEQPLTREHDGLGLGLAICKRVVELHQGMLRVESTHGVGSTFHIALRGLDDGEKC